MQGVDASQKNGRKPGFNRQHSIGFNVFMNMVLTSSRFIFPLVTVPYVSRVLSTYGTGAVAFSQSLAGYFSLAAVLGMTNYGLVTCSKVRDDPHELSATIRELMIILAASTALSLAVYLGACFCLPRLQENRSLFILFASTIVLTSWGVEWLYQALEEYAYITIRSIVFKFIGLLLMFIFVRESGDYFLYGICVIVSGYLSNVLNMVQLRRFISASPNRRINPSRHLKPMFWYSIATVSSGMYTQVDIVLLGFLGTTGMVGLYQLVSKIRSLAITSINSVGNVLLPRISYYVAQNRNDDVTRLIGKNASFVIIVSGAWICLCGLCSSEIVELLGGPDFADAALPLVLASPSVTFSSLNIALGGFLIANEREREWSIINVAGLALAACYSAILVPHFGVSGAALGITLTEFSVLIMRSARCSDLVRDVLHEVEPAKVLVSAATAALVSYGLGFPFGAVPVICSVLIRSLGFSFTYLVTLLAVKNTFVLDMSRKTIIRFRRLLSNGKTKK